MLRPYTTNIIFHGLDFDVCFKYAPGSEGKWTLSNGDPGYPGAIEELIITSITPGGVSEDWYDILYPHIEDIEDIVLKNIGDNNYETPHP